MGVPGCDVSPILEISEYVHDPVVGLIERLIIRHLNCPVSCRGDARLDVVRNEGGAEPVAVKALVGDQA